MQVNLKTNMPILEYMQYDFLQKVKKMY